MAIIASFPSLGGGRMVIPDYGGVAGTGPATFLNFPMTISDKNPTADGSREGAIWIQTKNLLGEATKILFSDTIPNVDSEDNVLYFVFPSLKSIKMDIMQSTGVWKPVEVHIAIGPDHPWLVGSLEDGSKMWLALPQMYSKIGGKVNIENAWYWHDESWQIISEVGRPFFKSAFAVNVIGSGMKTSSYLKTLPPGATSGENYFVSCTGEYIVVTKHVVRGARCGRSVSSVPYWSEEDSTFQIYKLSGATNYVEITEEIHLNSFDGIVPDRCEETWGSDTISQQPLIFFFNVACNVDASLLAVVFFSRDYGSALYFKEEFVILEKNEESGYVMKYHNSRNTIYKSLYIYGLASQTGSNISVDPSFRLFSCAKVAPNEYSSSGRPAYSALVSTSYYDGDTSEFITYKLYTNYTQLLPIGNVDTIWRGVRKVFDEFLFFGISTNASGSQCNIFFLTNGEGEVLDSYVLSNFVYIENASYERIGHYGVVTYATSDTGQTGNYIMGLSYDRETMEFVSTDVPVRTADQIYDSVDDIFPERQYLAHYSIQKDEALFTINGVTLLIGGEDGANFDLETGVITPATTMMDQGLKVYEDTVSRTGGLNIYIGD